jgi:hypothetical protein
MVRQLLLSLFLGVAAARGGTVASIADCLPLFPEPENRELVRHLTDATLLDATGSGFHPFPDTEIHRFRIQGVHRSGTTTVALELPAWVMENKLHLGFDARAVEKGLAILGSRLPLGWLKPAGFSTTRTTFRSFGNPQMLNADVDFCLSRKDRRFLLTVEYRLDLARGTLSESTPGPAELLRLVHTGEEDPHFQFFLLRRPAARPVPVTKVPGGLGVDLTYDMELAAQNRLVLGGTLTLRRRSSQFQLATYSLDIADLDKVDFKELKEVRTAPKVRYLLSRAVRGGHVFVESHPNGHMVKVYCGCGHWIHYQVGDRITVLATNLSDH